LLLELTGVARARAALPGCQSAHADLSETGPQMANNQDKKTEARLKR